MGTSESKQPIFSRKIFCKSCYKATRWRSLREEGRRPLLRSLDIYIYIHYIFKSIYSPENFFDSNRHIYDLLCCSVMLTSSGLVNQQLWRFIGGELKVYQLLTSLFSINMPFIPLYNASGNVILANTVCI